MQMELFACKKRHVRPQQSQASFYLDMSITDTYLVEFYTSHLRQAISLVTGHTVESLGS